MYSKLLGNNFSTVDAAIFGFLNIAKQTPRIITSRSIVNKETYPEYTIRKIEVQRTIEILKKAIGALKSHKNDRIHSSKK